MALDERERLELRHALVEALGPDNGNRLMDQVPPFDWAEVAMKSDLVGVEERLEVRFERFDARFERIEGRLDNVERLLENVERRLDTLSSQMDKLLARSESNRSMFLAVIGVVVAVAALTLAAATLAG